MNIVFFGDLNSYGRSLHRLNALKDLGHNVIPFSYVKLQKDNVVASYNLINKILWKLKIPLADNGANKSCASEVLNKKIDLVWVDNGLLFFPWTIFKIWKASRQTKIILFSEDDLCVWHGITFWLVLNFSKFSAIFTTKNHNLQTFKTLGKKNVFKISDSYIPGLHEYHDRLDSSEEICNECDVSAIGAYEHERASSLEFLAKNGVRVTVWGMGWNQHKTLYPNFLIIKNQFLFGIEYSKAINRSKININFLRKINRDTITSRSIEIPACGGFMISESTIEQKNVLSEGVDAEYFSNNDELLNKIRFYLKNEEKRKLIAKSGYEKVRLLKLDLHSIVDDVIEKTVRLKD